jgi:hypothetical protein
MKYGIIDAKKIDQFDEINMFQIKSAVIAVVLAITALFCLYFSMRS